MGKGERMGMTVLHISDIHIGDVCNNCSYENYLNGMVRALQKHYDKIIDIVIVTGDIFDGEDNLDDKKMKDKIKVAVEWFKHLLADINEREVQKTKKLSEEDILFVPGNHDICRPEVSYKIYDWFLDEFYFSKNEPNDYGKLHMRIKADEDKKFLFLGFNSVGSQNKAEISNEQLEYAEQQIGKKYNAYYKIAFFHHPSCLFPESNGDNYKDIIGNLSDLYEYLDRWNVQLVLYGHKHWAKADIVWLRSAYKVYMIAAGSSAKRDLQVYSSNIIEINDKRQIVLHRITSENTPNFELQKNIEIEDTFQRGLLRKELQNETFKDDAIIYVINMIDELYLDYSAFTVLQKDNNLQLLLFCIFYRILYRRSPSENIFHTLDIMKNQDLEFCKVYMYNVKKRLGEDFNIVLNLLCQNKVMIRDKELRDALEGDNERKSIFSYVLLAAFFVDLYLDFTLFWNEDSKKEPAEMVEFHEKGGIKYEINYNFICVMLISHDVQSYKKAIQKLNEYRRHFAVLRDYFRCIKLQVNYLYPIVKNDKDDELIYQEWEAYIPKLIPLLTGSNIYDSKFVFARELIQNAIDAISFREKCEQRFQEGHGGTDEKCIKIIIGNDDNGDFFSIEDHGIGMREDDIELYFATLGRSYYKEYEEEKGNLQYNPISNFGIGFLSVFRLCEKIVIQTRHFEEKKYKSLEIIEGQDYFLVKSDKNEYFDIGTKITCYLKEHKDNFRESLCQYIQSIMLDIKYKIIIDQCGEKPDISIESRKIRKIGKLWNTHVIFIPFEEKDRKALCILKKQLPEFLEKCGHGMLLDLTSKRDGGKGAISILNAGILMQNTELKDIFSDKKQYDIEHSYNKVYINFPPNWLQVDISREKATGIQAGYIDINNFRNEVYNSFAKQMEEYTDNYKDTVLAALSEAVQFIEQFCDRHEELVEIVLHVEFKENSIVFWIDKEDKNIVGKLKVSRKYHYIEKENGDEDCRIHKNLIMALHENLTGEELIKMEKAENDFAQDFGRLLERLGLSGWNQENVQYLPLILSACLTSKEGYLYHDINTDRNMRLEINQEAEKVIEKRMIKELLDKCTIADLNKKNLITVYKKIDNFEMSSDDLGERINAILDLEEYDAQNLKDKKYEFIWDKIILATYTKYYNETDKWDNLVSVGQSEYIRLNYTIKGLYGSNDNSKIDIFMIAACYIGSLLRISETYLGEKKTSNEPEYSKYKWILDSGVGLVYMWKCSEYRTGTDKKDPDLIRFQKLRTQGSLRWPEESEGSSKYYKYIRILSLTNPEKFAVLTFAELLSWLVFYNEEHFLND